ncbi:MAG: sensor histidine kinase, partial [Ardenticatenaceae bacterium]
EQYLVALREGDKRTEYCLQCEPASWPFHLTPSVARIVFAILQEAINNARKHAKASHIWVTLEYQPGGGEAALLIASVRDDGRGFNLEQIEGSYDERYSFGLHNMKERTDLIDASLQIESTPGAGTIIHLAIPWQDATSPPAPTP